MNLTETQLSIVDYAMIMGEPGSGKSISLFQIGYHYYLKGWHVYLLNGNNELTSIRLSENTENSLYLIDDAQIYPEYLINDICGQSRQNRKVLLAKTVTDQVRSEDILLTNDVAVNILYDYFFGIKDDILPIVSKCDKTVGANMNDISIEQRLESAKKAKTPWQFTYILRGDWNTIKNTYSSISKSHNLDLFLVTIATFQILNLDKSVDLSYINELYKAIGLDYKWTEKEISLLIKKHLVLSDDDIRIVHIESANIVVSLFFNSVQTEAHKALIQVIENEFRNKRVSPLGIVWLCNGCRYIYKYYSCAEQIFITDNIKKSADDQIKDLYTSEETRNMLFLLEKIIVADRNGQAGIQIYKNNESIFIKLINNADSVSALGFSYLLNSLYNHDKNIYSSLSQNVDWVSLMLKMVSEDNCDYYSWGRLFDRGLLLLGKKKYALYSEPMYSVMEQTVSKANINNIEHITLFLCCVCFLNYEKIHDLMPQLAPIYETIFRTNMERAIHIFDFKFLCYLCGIGILRKITPSAGQRSTANMIVKAINIDSFARVISRSNMNEWYSIYNVLLLVSNYDLSKYKEIIENVDLSELSEKAKWSWGESYEICMIIYCLATADKRFAIAFLNMNQKRIECYYSPMIAIDASSAIEANEKEGIPLELFTQHWWNESLSALKALAKTNFAFTNDYLEKSINTISERYNKVTALDFEERDSIDLLLLIRKINPETYAQIVNMIDKDKILKQWDQCGGIDPRKNRWIKQRKEVFINMIQHNK